LDEVIDNIIHLSVKLCKKLSEAVPSHAAGTPKQAQGFACLIGRGPRALLGALRSGPAAWSKI
jgi:hypothetical protein